MVRLGHGPLLTRASKECRTGERTSCFNILHPKGNVPYTSWDTSGIPHIPLNLQDISGVFLGIPSMYLDLNHPKQLSLPIPWKCRYMGMVQAIINYQHQKPSRTITAHCSLLIAHQLRLNRIASSLLRPDYEHFSGVNHSCLRKPHFAQMYKP